MITWMQRHKKYLIITIWISTIAFVGAGFVGWGQYSYGDKARSVAKVGDIDLTMRELNENYSRLYAQYNKMFQGNFDEEKAKQFGLQGQALEQLTSQALILNLAASYDLQISDAELLAKLRTQDYFFQDGIFNKEIYKQVLSRNNLSIHEYEADLRKQILVSKVLQLLPVEASDSEKNILNTVMSISDKINYKILTDNEVVVDTSDTAVKAFWENSKQNYMSEVQYDIKFIKQVTVEKEHSEEKISSHYSENKTHFKDNEGKILPLEIAKVDVIAELNMKATKDLALRTYIAYKKGKLDSAVIIETATISNSNNILNAETLTKVSKLSLTSPYMKPVLVDNEYFTIELVKVIPSQAKSYEEAKAEVLPFYVAQTKKTKLLELANSSVATFTGIDSDFLTVEDNDKIEGLEQTDANQFLIELFAQDTKRSFVVLNSGKIVLFNILEQKLLTNTNNGQSDSIVEIKSAMFNEGLIKNLRTKYPTEIFIEGL